MKYKNILIFVMSLILFSSFISLLSYDIEGQSNVHEFTEISVIARAKDSGSFEIIRQGIEQAAGDMRAEISFITLKTDNDYKEQIELIDREINNGAKAVLISGADSEKLVNAVEHAALKVPVVSVESPVYTDKVKAYISANNFEMGKSIASEIIRRGAYKKNIVILENSKNCGNVKDRIEGVIQGLEAADISVNFSEIPYDMEGAVNAVSKLINVEKADIIVALEPSVLETTAYTIQLSGNTNIRLYGIGSTGKIASYLEKGIIETIVAQNDFNIGYLGIKSAMDAIYSKTPDINTTVDYMTINSENMYSTKSQRLLFPFVR